MALFKSIKNNLGWISTPVSLIVAVYFLGGINMPSIPLYLVLGLLAIYMLLTSKAKFDISFLLLLLYLPFTILLARPDPVFNSWLRFGLFAALFITTSGLIQSPSARKFRKESLTILCWICVILSIGSFIAYFLGINLFVDRYTDEFYDEYVANGHFSGLCNHSMVLGPVAGVATTYLSYLAYHYKKWWIWLFAAMSASAALFAASRAAVGAALVGVVAIIYFTAKKKQQFLGRVLVIILVGLLTYPIWNSALDGIENKQNRTQVEGVFDSRTTKIEARIDEFVSSPIYGVGFSAIDPHGKDSFNIRTGSVEPGTSWLAILSMTGLIGFIIVVSIFYKSFKNAKMNVSNIWPIGILSFFIVHMLAEGYVFAAGNPMTYLLWITVGHCFDNNTAQSQ